MLLHRRVRKTTSVHQVVLLVWNGLRSGKAGPSRANVVVQRKLENNLSTFSVLGASGTEIRWLSATAKQGESTMKKPLSLFGLCVCSVLILGLGVVPTMMAADPSPIVGNWEGRESNGGEGGILLPPLLASADESYTSAIIPCAVGSYKRILSSATVSTVSLIAWSSA
jgi:hypothetical protein